jgi:hypothetical protein
LASIDGLALGAQATKSEALMLLSSPHADRRGRDHPAHHRASASDRARETVGGGLVFVGLNALAAAVAIAIVESDNPSKRMPSSCRRCGRGCWTKCGGPEMKGEPRGGDMGVEKFFDDQL